MIIGICMHAGNNVLENFLLIAADNIVLIINYFQAVRHSNMY